LIKEKFFYYLSWVVENPIFLVMFGALLITVGLLIIGFGDLELASIARIFERVGIPFGIIGTCLCLNK